MIKLRVPASTSNIGPGFDSLGLAFNLYNEFIFEEIEEGLEIIGFPEEFSNRDNLVYSSMLKTFQHIGYEHKGLKIHARASIPVSRGLGSSASCILAGVMAANELAGKPLNKDEIFELATSIEGHPDNIAPALFGGFVVSIMENGKPISNGFQVHKGIKFIALVPDFTLSTKESRAVLPSTIDHKDAVSNVSRVSLLLSALGNGRFDLLKDALKDKLHQPYRGGLINNFYDIMEEAENLGALGVFLSGAGPTIMCIVAESDNTFIEDMREYLQDLENEWEIIELGIDLNGSQID